MERVRTMQLRCELDDGEVAEERQMQLVKDQRREAIENDVALERDADARAARERELDDEDAHDTGDEPDDDEVQP